MASLRKACPAKLGRVRGIRSGKVGPRVQRQAVGSDIPQGTVFWKSPEQEEAQERGQKVDCAGSFRLHTVI